MDMDLPARGYPIARDSVAEWFRRQYGREPTALEIGEILLKMSERDSTPPGPSTGAPD